MSNALREKLLSQASGVLADICNHPDASYNWRREADLLVKRWTDDHGDFVWDVEALVPMFDWWQSLRINKNSDFPLGGLS